MILRYFSWTASCRKTLLLLIFSFFSFNIISQETFTVNTTADTKDINLKDNLCMDLNGNCSLRAAIQNANLTSEADNIYFDIAGEGPHTISLKETLPVIELPTVIDGKSQHGYTFESPQIVISGKNIPLSVGTVKGLEIIGEKASNSKIVGLVVGNFGIANKQYGVGISIRFSNNNIVQANYIGIAADGESPFNNDFGIEITGENNLIGGPDQKERNIISGNRRNGVEIGYGSGRNKIQGNYIGTNNKGTQKVPNGLGVLARETNTYDANLISGNETGLFIEWDENLVINNFIGTDYSGKIAIPNSVGIYLAGEHNQIGTPGFGNLISGNLQMGIEMSGGSYNILEANHIGTDIDGINPLPNNWGIMISGGTGNYIGGLSKESSNIISGNLDSGIYIGNSNQNEVYGNIIGIQADGVLSLSNGKAGIFISGNNNQIGDTNPDLANIIGMNSQGVAVTGNENKISGNSMFGNSLGIDLGADNRRDRNDRNDADSGPNNLQNFPELITANVSGSSLELFYSMDSDPAHSTYPLTIEIFKSDGNRQGKQFIGTFQLTEKDLPIGRSKSNLNQLLNLSTGIILAEGDLILATSTDSAGNTSEFSPEIAVSITGGCTQIWYADSDGDGFGAVTSSIEECTQPLGYVQDNTDCDDSDKTIYPGAVDDTVDGIDQDCDEVDGPVTSCTGSDLITVSEVCSTATSVIWEITNPGSCHVDGRWELRKNSSTGDSSGTFSLVAGETIQIISGVVSKGKTQIIVYWNDPTGTELNSSSNASGITCLGSQSAMNSSLTPELFVSPNPVTEGGIGIYFTTVNTDSILNGVIYNSSGQQMASQSFSVRSGTTSLIWDLDHSSWIEGVYILNVTINNGTYQAQFIK